MCRWKMPRRNDAQHGLLAHVDVRVGTRLSGVFAVVPLPVQSSHHRAPRDCSRRRLGLSRQREFGGWARALPSCSAVYSRRGRGIEGVGEQVARSRPWLRTGRGGQVPGSLRLKGRCAIASRRPLPPTAEPLRPLTRSDTGRTNSLQARQNARRLKKYPYKIKLLRFQVIAGTRVSRLWLCDGIVST